MMENEVTREMQKSDQMVSLKIGNPQLEKWIKIYQKM